MVDPKVVELGVYNGIPHLLVPVVTDPRKAAGALGWAVTEMMERYKLFGECNVRKLEEYNRFAEKHEGYEKRPRIVIVIDELADLMMVAPNEVEDSICRLAQLARAAGMHLVIATQRPSVDVITGVIKTNIPSRIAFAVANQFDSRTILDSGGAEKLLGRGDMLYSPVGASKPTRIQGCFVTDREIEAILAFVKEQSDTEYSDQVMEEHRAARSCPRRGPRRGALPTTPKRTGTRCCLEATEAVVEAGLRLGHAAAKKAQAGLCPRLPHHGRVGGKRHCRPVRRLQAPQGAHHQASSGWSGRTKRPIKLCRFGKTSIPNGILTCGKESMRDYLPVSKEDMDRRGWDAVDFVLVTGDAYVDHPSFGAAIVSRLLEAEGFRVAILAQPGWKTAGDFARFGRPKLGFMVTSGNIDSMVAHYTAAKKRRSDDFYSPGRKAGLRRSGGDRLLPEDPGTVWRHSHRDRRAGGFSPAVCPLRLLGRRGARLCLS